MFILNCGHAIHKLCMKNECYLKDNNFNQNVKDLLIKLFKEFCWNSL